jgi:diacylglycerol kinase
MKRLFNSFGYALKGISTTIREERNMKIHLFVSLAVIIAGVVFSISTIEWLMCIFCMGLVFSAELFNTAIEELVNAVSAEKTPVFGRVKDIAAGAVFVCAITSVIVGVIIFLPKLIHAFILPY